MMIAVDDYLRWRKDIRNAKFEPRPCKQLEPPFAPSNLSLCPKPRSKGGGEERKQILFTGLNHVSVKIVGLP